MKYSSVISAFLIALGLLAMGLCVKSAIKAYGERDRVVTVRGLCEKEVQANKVTWPLVTKEMGNDLPQIYDRIQATNRKILAFLKSNGIAENEISVNSPDVTDRIADRYSDDGNITSRYSVTNVIVVTSSKVELVRKLIDKQADLLREGIAVIAGNYQYPTTYEYTELNSVKPEMIAEATAKAREAADKFAQDSQSKLGKIKTASQGQFSISDRDQFTPYIKNIRVVTTLEYYLED
ncbi:MAG: SIMPL domain-containing protein [Muribaculaceae bacterium]|nr:SIMPL domain-containing protein [Muribaculaceae bacterium]MDE6130501.1 SIMPL domain-containing protein [Muribaculaceae bacterium]